MSIETSDTATHNELSASKALKLKLESLSDPELITYEARANIVALFDGFNCSEAEEVRTVLRPKVQDSLHKGKLDSSPAWVHLWAYLHELCLAGTTAYCEVDIPADHHSPTCLAIDLSGTTLQPSELILDLLQCHSCARVIHRPRGVECLTTRWTEILDPLNSGIDFSTPPWQASLLHLFSAFQTRYAAPQPSTRKLWRTIIPTLVRRMFEHPRVTFSVLSRYLSGSSVAEASILRNLNHELARLSILDERSGHLRRKIAHEVRITGKGPTEVHGNLLSKALHGEVIGTPGNHEHKPTNLVQCTFFTRRFCLKQDHLRVPYTEHFSNTFSKVPLLEFVPTTGWRIQSIVQKPDFEALVRDQSEGGFPVAWLDALFKQAPSPKDEQRLSPGGAVWISDGEISFLTMVAAAILTNATLTKNVHFSAQSMLFAAEPRKSVLISMVFSNFTKLVTSCLGLMGTLDGAATGLTDRFWSLYNFLDRVELRRVSPFLDDDSILRGHASKLLGALTVTLDKTQDSERVLRTLSVWYEGLRNKIPEEISELQARVRFGTFLIEAFKNEGKTQPTTLGFFPILGRGSTPSGAGLPHAILAATFMGLESAGWPFVSSRLDSHMDLAIKLLQPIIHHHIGNRLHEDHSDAMALAAEREATRIADKEMKQIMSTVDRLRSQTQAVRRRLSPGSKASAFG